MKKIRVFEAFAGVGSQRMALRNLGVNFEVVGIAEIDVDAIISYGAIHYGELNKDIENIEEERQVLKDKNVGFDFKVGKSKLDRMKKDKLKYLINANKVSKNFGDISKINPNDLPDMDLFTYSFPCQDLSIAGKQAGLGEETRSGLLYECEKVIEVKRPKYLLLENVKNLVGKKFKNDFDKWLEYLEGLGYKNHWKVLNAKDYGVPQNRERVFAVSILEEKEFEFEQPKELKIRLKHLLEKNVDEKYYINKPFKLVDKKNVKAKLQIKGMDCIKRVYSRDGISPTLTTMSGGNREPKILEDYKIRKLTPLECWRLMGFNDEDFYKASQYSSNSQLYKQAGNSIVVDVLESIFKNLF